MIIGIPKEIMHEEARVAATPDTVKKYVADGHKVLVEKGAGVGALHSDEAYAAAGSYLFRGGRDSCRQPRAGALRLR